MSWFATILCAVLLGGALTAADADPTADSDASAPIEVEAPPAAPVRATTRAAAVAEVGELVAAAAREAALESDLAQLRTQRGTWRIIAAVEALALLALGVRWLLRPQMRQAIAVRSDRLRRRLGGPVRAAQERTDQLRRRLVVRHAGDGFTLLEAMLALAVLGIVLASVLSAMATLNHGSQQARERATAQQIAHALSEKVIAGTWDILGVRVDASVLSDRNAWSWHRREHPTAANGLPPMDEVSADPHQRIDEVRDAGGRLLSPGLVVQRTGLRNVKVYLEYYRMAAVGDMVVAPDPRGSWRSLIASTSSPFIYDDTDRFLMDLRGERDAVLVRVLVTWEPLWAAGVTQRYELVFARRK